MRRDPLPRSLATVVILFSLLGSSHMVLAQTNTTPPPVAEKQPWQPLFFGYETEPGMDFGGRTVSTMQSALSHAFGSIGKIGEKRPALAAIWEFVGAAAVMLIQHEVGGHGGRGREYNLHPSYGFGFDFSGYTSLRDAPRTNLQGSLLAAGGSEADGILAHRVLMDGLRSDGVDGAKLPLALITKLDLSMYVDQTPKPTDSDFTQTYRDGNDVAFWLVSRQADRRGYSPALVWEGDYRPDTKEKIINDNWRAARNTALWNLLDPSMIGAMAGYFKQHLREGRTRVHTPVWHITRGFGLTAGTRGALGPRGVSRFLDIYATTNWGVANVYVRDLDSSIDRTYGYGGALHGVRLGRYVDLGISADSWKEPKAYERSPFRSSCWNAAVEIDARFGSRWGLSAKVGNKTEGFFPGRPYEKGQYVGVGVTAVW